MPIIPLNTISFNEFKLKMLNSLESMANSLHGRDALFEIDVYVDIGRRRECLAWGNPWWESDASTPLNEITSLVYESFCLVFEHLEVNKENISLYVRAEFTIF